MTRSTTSTLALLLAYAAAPAGVGAQVSFGTSATVTAGEILVGEPHHELRPGVVFTYRRDGSGRWIESQRLEAPDGTPGDRFGIRSVVRDGHLLVSATRADGGTGAVYLFRKDGERWVSEGRLPIEGLTPADSLGSGLAVDGEWAMAGTVARDRGRGAVYVLRRDGGEWVQHSVLAPTDLEAEDRFGGAVALLDGWALVSAPTKGDDAGAVYAFRYDATSDVWRPAGRLDGQMSQPGAGFGSALALGDGRAFVGAPGLLSVGAVVELEADEESGEFQLASLLLPFHATPGSGFGSDLALAGDELWVGSPGGGGSGQGRAYVYRWDGDEGEWVAARMVAPGDLSRGDSFGGTVAAEGDVVVGGALGEDYGAGAAYVFERRGEGWSEGQRLASEVLGPEPVTGDEVRCSEEGAAALFDCSEVDMMSFLPVAHMGAGRGVRTNDVWGWKDPVSGREIAIVGMTDQTAFVDVTDPYRPVYLGRLPMTEGARGSAWRDMKVYEDHVFVVSDGAGPHGVQVMDLTKLRGANGGDPVTFEADALYDRIHSAHNIVINTESGFAYVVGASGGGETCGGGLHMIDVREPLQPAFAGCFADASTGRSRTGYSHDAQCVVYRGPDEEHRGKEICLGANETALSIADVTDKESPTAIAMATYPNVGYTHQGWLSEDQAYFFMNDELDETGGLVPTTRTLVWDIRDLDDPILALEHFSENRSSDHNLYVVGNTMYQSNYVSGLRVLDVSDPLNPVHVGYFDTVPYGEDAPGFNGSWSNYPFFEGGVVVVTSGREGLFLLKPRHRSLIP